MAAPKRRSSRDCGFGSLVETSAKVRRRSTRKASAGTVIGAIQRNGDSVARVVEHADRHTLEGLLAKFRVQYSQFADLTATAAIVG